LRGHRADPAQARMLFPTREYAVRWLAKTMIAARRSVTMREICQEMSFPTRVRIKHSANLELREKVKLGGIPESGLIDEVVCQDGKL
jgi:hypothetical protein